VLIGYVFLGARHQHLTAVSAEDNQVYEDTTSDDEHRCHQPEPKLFSGQRPGRRHDARTGFKTTHLAETSL
jgi:hypothetical protein